MLNLGLLNILEHGNTGVLDQNKIVNKDKIKDTLESELKVLSKYNMIISKMIDFVKTKYDF